VQVILEELQDDQPSASEELPRIWWIGTGIAGSFPFHAAGQYTEDYSENALSRMIPSYTPTIKALAHSRLCASRAAKLSNDKISVLMVTMPKTPGQKTLDGVDHEKVAIQESAKDFYTVKTLEYPTAEHVLNDMKGFDIVHFACHGSSDSANPSNSHLLLPKNDVSGPIVDKLTVSDISNADTLGQAWIAYLSACSTAEVKAERFADESLHIASAFQVAGFAHVIGSLWSADDDVCVRVARLFYDSLTRSGTAVRQNRAVAEALRSALVQVRSDFIRDPSVWAPYIHSGA
jgi:CHAT domain-containing protein